MSRTSGNSDRRPQGTRENRRHRRGFSLLELMIVIAMGLVVAALAVPNVLMSVANLRLRSAANSISGVIQDARIRAVKQNSRTQLLAVTQDSARLMCVDENLNNTCDATERRVQLPNSVTRLTAPPAGSGAPSSTVDATVGITSPQVASLPSFNPRGLPCLFNAGACTTNTGFVIYLAGAQPLGSNSWAAITITPAGRVKTWFWTGAAWGN
jgi:prepilin-type N-terminal cleavage/methylation domain-containing protein